MEGVQLPGDIDVVGVTGSPGGDDGDVVEAEGLPTGLPDSDVDFHCDAPLTAE